MDREELKAHCERQIEECEKWAKLSGKEPGGKIYEEHKLILELLQSAPCEEAISRQEAVRIASIATLSIDQTVAMLKLLPPVQPKATTKPVIYSGDGYADGNIVYDYAECPNCGYEYEDGDKDWKEPFCPHCGQALKWEVESEE